MKIGLIGWNVDSGLGRYNADLARHLPLEIWLIPTHPDLPSRRAPSDVRNITLDSRAPLDELSDRIAGLDWLLFVETPYIDGLPELARQRKVRLAVIPMAENFNPRLSWLSQVDLVLPPTRHCEAHARAIREEYRLGWQIVYVPGAVDTLRLPFRERNGCQRFLFCNGHGGFAGRKGIRCLAEAAWQIPEIPIVVYSQTGDLPSLPDNVEMRSATPDSADLYREGDVAVQPSRWEGLGLQLLEAQACGLPLITTDAPPMSEYRPLKTVAADQTTLLIRDWPVTAYDARPSALAQAMREVWNTDIGEASRQARAFIEQHHSWQHVAGQILTQLEAALPAKPHRSKSSGSRLPLEVEAIIRRVPPDTGCALRIGRHGSESRRWLEGRGCHNIHEVLLDGSSSGPNGLDRQFQAACNEQALASSQPYDLVLCDALEQLRDPLSALRSVHAVLKPGGHLIVTFNNMRHFTVLEALLRGDWPAEGCSPLTPDQLRYFTKREVEKLLFRSGFSQTEMFSSSGEGMMTAGDASSVGLVFPDLDPEDQQDFHTEHYVVCARAERVEQYPLTSIVILTHNQCEFTRLCLNSLRMFTDEPYELIVVDNGSTDGTVDYLRRQPDIHLIENADNRGFPAGSNQGLRAAHGRQMLLLNNDVVVSTGWLRRMLAALRSDQAIGLVGPCSNCVSGSQQVSAGYTDLSSLDGFAWQWARRHLGQLEDTDRLVGFCLLIEREVIDRIGLLDERFGLGNFEDDDFCRRARDAGFRAVIARDAYVHHFGGMTYRTLGRGLGQLMRRNHELYVEKWEAMSPLDEYQDRRAPSGDDAATRSSGPVQDSPVPSTGAANEAATTSQAEVQLSLCMIVRDAAQTLAPCLDSIRPWVDEIVVVDTGSLDNTAQIAARYGARVFHAPWQDSFATARNQSLQHARGRWIFWMDADDTIDEQNGRQLRELADCDHAENVLGYVLQVHCPGASEFGCTDVTIVDHVKLFRNHPAIRFEGRVHEQVLMPIRRLGGDVQWTNIFVVHSGADRSTVGRRRKQDRDLRLLELELEERPYHPFTLFNLGMTCADMGRHAEAVRFLERSLSASDRTDSHVRKIYALLLGSGLELERLDDCQRWCREARALFPDDPELVFREGMLAHRLGALDAAARSYQRILENGLPQQRYFSSFDVGILGFKARHNLGVVYSDMGKPELAENQWRAIIDQQPEYRPAWQGLGESLLAQGRLEDATRLVFDMKIRGQLIVEAALLEAEIAQRTGDYASARRILDEAQRVEDLRPLSALCQLLFEQGPLTDAASALSRLVDRRPEDPSVHHNLGTTLLRLGHYHEAVQHYRRSLELRPDFAESQHQLAVALSHISHSSPPDALADLDGCPL